jgi:cytochrome c oxidase subunit 3
MHSMIPAPSLTGEESPAMGYRGGGFDSPPNNDGGNDGREGSGPPDYGQRLRHARLGLLCATISILVLFLAFTAVFVIRHGSSTFDERSNSYITNWIKVSLPTDLLLINTIILLASSLTMEMARRHIARDVALAPVRSIPGITIGRERGFPWLAATAALGIAFLCGQGMAWRELIARGFYLSSGASSSFVYLLTATHAVHLTGGILVLLYCVVTYFFHRSVESRQIVVDVTAWYWHFMLFLWVYIFALLEFA